MRIVLAALLVATSALAAPADADLPSVLAKLGQKIVTQKQQLENVDVTVTGKQEELDSKGKVEHVTESVVKTTHANGQTTREVLKATQDGNDITDQMKKQFSGKPDDDQARAENPFDPELQAAYKFTRVSDPSSTEWKVHFEPIQPGTMRIRGDAWIDPTTADLVRLTAEPVERPAHMDRAELTEEFGQKSPWGNLRSKLTMYAEGSIMWIIHRRVRGVAQFTYALPK